MPTGRSSNLVRGVAQSIANTFWQSRPFVTSASWSRPPAFANSEHFVTAVNKFLVLRWSLPSHRLDMLNYFFCQTAVTGLSARLGWRTSTKTRRKTNPSGV